MRRNAHRGALGFLVLVGGYGLAGCAVALGPGYTLEKHEITVKFVQAEPSIHINAFYQLRNTGNQPLTSLELRLAGRRRFHFADPRAEWDARTLPLETSPTNPRNVLLSFPQPWTVGKVHTLRLSVTYERAAADENALSFAPDAFFLPAQGWSPELLPARGILANGGVPPKKWNLIVQVPDDFVVHISGRSSKTSRRSGGQTIRALQRPQDGYPFVIAGRFSAIQLRAGTEVIHLWKRSPATEDILQKASEPLTRAIHAYDSMFGTLKNSDQLWIVECPVVAGCFSSSSSNYAKLVSDESERVTAEMAATDTVMVDLSSGAPPIDAEAAPSLASSWLGYGQSPGFFQQTPPLSALPAFAAFRAHEAVEGPQVRTDTIRQLLRRIPASHTPGQFDDDTALRAKSVLFFYALQDRFGLQAFDAGLRHMLEARRGGGFDIYDLVATLEAESHQSVAPFVRVWMKHPGVPSEFRARYESTSAASSKEKP